MTREGDAPDPLTRRSPIEMSPEEFRSVGHRAIDLVADLLASLPERKVTPAEEPSAVRARLPQGALPSRGRPAAELVEEAAALLADHSLFSGHPRFWGYITSSPAPIGFLADLLAAAVNPNTGAWALSPVATEIEAQTVRWIAELLGYPPGCGGLLVSGGNMANFVCFLAARKARLPGDPRAQGLGGEPAPTVYVSEETHTWIQKAADLFGHGTDAIRWIPVDRQRRIDLDVLERRISEDRAGGRFPLLAVGTAGTVGVGAIDPLPAMADLCRRHGIWFHVDGAYGAPAAALPEASEDLKGLSAADSIAVDPHKWLYSPLEAGCALVREPGFLRDAFRFEPQYYRFSRPDEEPRINYHEYGPQNSRGFRALKVWLGLRQVGRDGYVRMIREDIALARALFDSVRKEEELEAATQSLSITTFRFVPKDLRAQADRSRDYLNELNREILDRIQTGGEAFVSNAVVDQKFLLRACIVNFRTTLADIEMLPKLAVRLGRELDARRRSGEGPDARRAR